MELGAGLAKKLSWHRLHFVTCSRRGVAVETSVWLAFIRRSYIFTTMSYLAPRTFGVPGMFRENKMERI